MVFCGGLAGNRSTPRRSTPFPATAGAANPSRWCRASAWSSRSTPASTTSTAKDRRTSPATLCSTWSCGRRRHNSRPRPRATSAELSMPALVGSSSSGAGGRNEGAHKARVFLVVRDTVLRWRGRSVGPDDLQLVGHRLQAIAHRLLAGIEMQDHERRHDRGKCGRLPSMVGLRNDERRLHPHLPLGSPELLLLHYH